MMRRVLDQIGRTTAQRGDRRTVAASVAAMTSCAVPEVELCAVHERPGGVGHLERGICRRIGCASPATRPLQEDESHRSRARSTGRRHCLPQRVPKRQATRDKPRRRWPVARFATGQRIRPTCAKPAPAARRATRAERAKVVRSRSARAHGDRVPCPACAAGNPLMLAASAPSQSITETSAMPTAHACTARNRRASTSKWRAESSKRLQAGIAAQRRNSGAPNNAIVEAMCANRASASSVVTTRSSPRNRGVAYGATSNVKSPLVTCASTESTRQLTRQVPGGKVGTVISSTLASAGSTRATAWVTRVPFATAH